MINFQLYNDTIVDFSRNEIFTRFSMITNSLGREELVPLSVGTAGSFQYSVTPYGSAEYSSNSFNQFCYIHPASDKELQTVNQQGEHIENMIKIFARVDANIIPDDRVEYMGLTYRVLKSNTKLVGDYSKYFAGLLSD